ncbi:MAG: hypothetical protein ACFCGT_04485 [Sandaracinaceae bacterium]
MTARVAGAGWVLASLLLVVMGLAATPARSAAEPPSVDPALARALMSIHRRPHREALEAAFPGLERRLLRLARRRAEAPWVRDRALQVLDDFPSRRVSRLYRRLLEDDGSLAEMTRFRLLRRLARRDPAGAVRPLRQARCGGSALMRRAAEAALATFPDELRERVACPAIGIEDRHRAGASRGGALNWL